MTLRLTIAQSPGELTGVHARLEWLLAQETAVQETDLLLLPELSATGYNIGSDLSDLAEAADGPIFQAMAQAARALGCAICYGYPERVGGEVFNSVQCVAADGEVLGHHRKLAIPPGPETAHFTAGTGVKLFRFRGLQVAILICYDAEFPETLRHVTRAGAQLVLVPTALGAQWGVVANAVMPTRAFENGVWLAYANHCGVENGLSYLGRSVIAAPDGQEPARANASPCLIHAEITAEAVQRAQDRLPYLRDLQRLCLE